MSVAECGSVNVGKERGQAGTCPLSAPRHNNGVSDYGLEGWGFESLWVCGNASPCFRLPPVRARWTALGWWVMEKPKQDRMTSRAETVDTASESRSPGWPMYLLVAITAVLLAWFVIGLFGSDAIESADTCAELEVAMYDASRARGATATDTWDADVVPRIAQRYESLACGFDFGVLYQVPKGL